MSNKPHHTLAEQLSVFGAPVAQETKELIHYWKLYIDGASRGNPGPAGAGMHIIKNGESFLKRGFYLGKKTNNQAEYRALLLGLFFLQHYCSPQDVVLIISDSELMIRQLKGVYKVKNEGIAPLFKLARQLLAGFNCSVEHVLREHNKDADEMANAGIDKKILVPREFTTLLVQHGIQD